MPRAIGNSARGWEIVTAICMSPVHAACWRPETAALSGGPCWQPAPMTWDKGPLSRRHDQQRPLTSHWTKRAGQLTSVSWWNVLSSTKQQGCVNDRTGDSFSSSSVVYPISAMWFVIFSSPVLYFQRAVRSLSVRCKFHRTTANAAAADSNARCRCY